MVLDEQPPDHDGLVLHRRQVELADANQLKAEFFQPAPWSAAPLSAAALAMLGTGSEAATSIQVPGLCSRRQPVTDDDVHLLRGRLRDRQRRQSKDQTEGTDQRGSHGAAMITDVLVRWGAVPLVVLGLWLATAARPSAHDARTDAGSPRLRRRTARSRSTSPTIRVAAAAARAIPRGLSRPPGEARRHTAAPGRPRRSASPPSPPSWSIASSSTWTGAKCGPPRSCTSRRRLPPSQTARRWRRTIAFRAGWARTRACCGGSTASSADPLSARQFARADGQVYTEWIDGTAWSRPIDLTGQFTPPSRWTVIRQYVALGYTHILPKGVDHILFVIGLFLLSPRLRTMLTAGDRVHGGALDHAGPLDLRHRRRCRRASSSR